MPKGVKNMLKRDEDFLKGMKILMEEYNLSQAELSRQAGFAHPVSINRIYKGIPASEDAKWSIAEVFDLTPEGVMEVGRQQKISPSPGGLMDYFREGIRYILNADITRIKHQTDLATKAGLSSGVISQILSGKRGCEIKTIDTISRALGIEAPEILEMGRKMLLGQDPAKPFEPIEPPPLEVKTANGFKGHVNGAISSGTYVPVRLLKDSVAGGAPAEIREDDIEGWALIYADREWMPNAPDHYTCAHIRGESMYPVLSDGDIVAIDHATKPNTIEDLEHLDGEMCAFRVNGGVTVKWLKWMPEKETVLGLPENKDEIDHLVMLKGEEINGSIVGKIAWWWAKR